MQAARDISFAAFARDSPPPARAGWKANDAPPVSASALTCLLLPAAAQAFPIDLEAHLDGVTIETRTTDISNIATVTLRNAGANTALCEATFVNGPERPAPRRVRLAAGESTVVSQSFQRAITRVRVDVRCSVN